MNKPARLVVLISGSGSNLQALINAVEADRLPAQIAAVVSNRYEAYGLKRAEQHRLPLCVLPALQPRPTYDAALARLVAGFEPDWVILAGWMRLLTMNFLGQFPNRVVNLHPALPGTFPGTHVIERAFTAYRRGEIDHTGIMVHLVPDEGVDDGPVLAAQPVPIWPDDTLDSLTERVHAAEHEVLVNTLRGLITGEIMPPGL
jgi:formyltetrahydrofolate-dependent phosphoribosylglycinamide formyltransferase